MRKIIDTPEYTVTTNDPAITKANKEYMDKLYEEAQADGRSVTMIVDGRSLSSDEIKEMFLEFFLDYNETVNRKTHANMADDPQIAMIKRMDSLDSKALAAMTFYTMHASAYTMKAHADKLVHGDLDRFNLIVRGLTMDLMAAFDSMTGMGVDTPVVLHIRDAIYIATDKFIRNFVPTYDTTDRTTPNEQVVDTVIMLMEEFKTEAQLLEHTLIQPMSGAVPMLDGLVYFSTLAGKLYDTIELSSDTAN